MTQLKVYAISFLCLLALPAFAQIQKGNYSFGGDMGVTGDFQRDKYFNSTEFNVSLSPSISKFLTNKWLVGVRPILSTKVYTGDYIPLGSPVTYKGNFTRLGLELSSRYYLNESNTLRVFGFAQASYERVLNNSAYREFRGDTIDINFNTHFLQYQVGLGANYFLKPDVALEGTVSYFHSEMPSTHVFIGSRLINASENLLLNLKMANFLSFTSKTDTKVSPDASEKTPQYIRQGRQTIGGNMWMRISKTTDNKTITSFQFNPQFSQLITNKLMLLGDFNATSNFQDNIGAPTLASVSAMVAVRYYMPIKKRLFIYPQFNYTYITGDSYIYRDFKQVVGLSLGGNYFLSDNIALEATFLQSNAYLRNQGAILGPKALFTTIGLGNVGLRYFIR